MYGVFLPNAASPKDAKEAAFMRPESDYLKAWFGNWITVDWATEWIRRYASSIIEGAVKLQADDFGLKGFPGVTPDLRDSICDQL